MTNCWKKQSLKGLYRNMCWYHCCELLCSRKRLAYRYTGPIQISRNCRTGWGVVCAWLLMILHGTCHPLHWILLWKVDMVPLDFGKPLFEVKCRHYEYRLITLRLLIKHNITLRPLSAIILDLKKGIVITTECLLFQIQMSDITMWRRTAWQSFPRSHFHIIIPSWH